PALPPSDLKPQNLLLDGAGHVKVCDFGLARIMRNTPMRTEDTHAGTPAYMAPELFEGSMISEKVDVYAFAMTMYECFTGIMPWSWLAGEMQIITLVCLRGRRPRVPEWAPPFLARLINACWAAEPRERPHFRDILYLLQREMEAVVSP
ncbi:hypothetical protein VOLCADRAFT_47089, partial [Volvox carteri f. nagariensis]